MCRDRYRHFSVAEGGGGGQEEPTLGTLVEARREELGLTKSEAARQAGISRGTWHEIETGKRQQVQPDKLNSVARVLQLRPDVLRARSGRLAIAATGPKTPWSGTREMSIQLQLDELRRLILDIGDQIAELRELTAQAIQGSSGGDDVVE